MTRRVGAFGYVLASETAHGIALTEPVENALVAHDTPLAAAERRAELGVNPDRCRIWALVEVHEARAEALEEDTSA